MSGRTAEATLGVRPAWAGPTGLVRAARMVARYPSGTLGAGLLLLVCVAALFSSAVAPYDPIATDTGAVLRSPSAAHLAGTDPLGRDIFSQIVFGSRVSLYVLVGAIGISLSAGVVVGLASGYWAGSYLDEGLMRLMDMIYLVPDIALAMAVAGVFGGDTPWGVILALALVRVPGYARLIRSAVLSIRAVDFVSAARSLGATPARVVGRHILPNVTSLIVVRTTVSASGVLLGEATLSFLGLGVPPPAPSWGRMLRAGFDFLDAAPWVPLAPGFAIFVLVLALNLVGDTLQDVLDPQRRS
ncbi:MAG: ABC transporter permease [Candidatus Rokubacteria bacterium]|nr:ABC transporter permease [Candidatus Rokubacteria bacterium]